MPNSKQRREQARRHLERQLVRRQQRDLRRRKLNLIGTVVGVLVLFAVVITTVLMLSHEDKSNTANPAASNSASASPSATGTPAAQPSAEPDRGPLGQEDRRPVQVRRGRHQAHRRQPVRRGPAAGPQAHPDRQRDRGVPTNQGTITVTLDGASAPCNVQSIKYLISKKFYDNTACPRSVNSGIFVVQCGDPSGTTSGGPTYTTKDEGLTKVSYTEGTLAMANSGPNTNGSQFFFITKDSNGSLGKNYSVIGHVTGGLDILKKVATGGDDGSNQAGGGKPNVPLYFKTVTLKA